ncbi:MAG TPA: pyridoxal phosphate-dependent aminotransferase [Vicinamibacterales bacterium]|nr:pyridoxal phosphate-dependent aminotransferase [Vicinamibacterales bacterium]
MISSRLPRDLSPNATARAVDALRASGADVIDLTESNPTRAGFPYPDKLLEPLASARGLRYDPHPLGSIEAREAVSREFLRRGLQMPPDHIGLTSSTSEAYSFLFKLLCNPGDAVLVPTPSYPLFDHLTSLESVVPLSYSLEYHGSWRVDIDSVRSQLNDTVRALLIVSPNNPTGSFLHADDLTQLTEICAAHGMMMVGDEVFADFTLDDAPHAVSPLAQNEALVCSLGGLSKSGGLPQVKFSWIGFAGPSPQLEELLVAYEIVADTYLSVSTPVQVAASTLLAEAPQLRAAIHERVRQNLTTLRDQARNHPAVTVLACEGGWSAVLQLPALRSEEALVLELLNEDHVFVHPGYFFDFPRESFVVVSLLVPPELFSLGISRVLMRATLGRGSFGEGGSRDSLP